MEPKWLTDEEQRAWRAYMRAQTMLSVQLGRQLQADSGLSLPEYEVLVHLSEAPEGRLRPFQLGSDLGWEQSRMSHQLSRMARRGFVSREECPGDARGALVVLTAAGGLRGHDRRGRPRRSLSRRAGRDHLAETVTCGAIPPGCPACGGRGLVILPRMSPAELISSPQSSPR